MTGLVAHGWGELAVAVARARKDGNASVMLELDRGAAELLAAMGAAWSERRLARCCWVVVGDTFDLWRPRAEEAVRLRMQGLCAEQGVTALVANGPSWWHARATYGPDDLSGVPSDSPLLDPARNPELKPGPTRRQGWYAVCVLEVVVMPLAAFADLRHGLTGVPAPCPTCGERHRALEPCAPPRGGSGPSWYGVP